MSVDNRKICPLCAWRGTCAKRFSRGDDSTLHCPDFSEDVTLRRAVPDAANDHPMSPSAPDEKR